MNNPAQIVEQVDGIADHAIARVRFHVIAQTDLQTLPRLINWFSQRGFIPARVQACTKGNTMTVVIEQDDLSDLQAGVIADKMRSSVMVERVDVTRGTSPIRPLETSL